MPASRLKKKNNDQNQNQNQTDDSVSYDIYIYVALTELERHVQHLRVGHAHKAALARAKVGAVHAPPPAAAVVHVEVTRTAPVGSNEQASNDDVKNQA